MFAVEWYIVADEEEDFGWKTQESRRFFDRCHAVGKLELELCRAKSEVQPR